MFPVGTETEHFHTAAYDPITELCFREFVAQKNQYSLGHTTTKKKSILKISKRLSYLKEFFRSDYHKR